uniref:Uncharacterized protein n=1 Tax=Anguilla anguilla TaxID=7936 RepID=A0A0E9VIZ8_ANGAN
MAEDQQAVQAPSFRTIWSSSHLSL